MAALFCAMRAFLPPRRGGEQDKIEGRTFPKETPMSAPLDLAALQNVLLPFGPSRLLPQAAYTSKDVLAWEQKHFFEGSWVCGGTSEGLEHPGDQKAIRVGSDGIVLVRGDDGVLRGFFNSCRHRSHELLQLGECASSRSIRCPYHGWTYNLDGSLKASVMKSHAAGFEPSAEGLIPARIELWHGWIFVNASGDALPFSEWVGDLEAITKPYEPERLRVGATHQYEIAANWKLICENYHECYHCPQIHPQLCKVSPPDSGENAVHPGAFIGGNMELTEGAVTMSMDGHSDGARLRGVTGALARQVHYYGLFPNVLLSYHPDYVMSHRMEPLAPNRTKVECQWLFPPESLDTPGFDPKYAVEFWDTTNWQDWRAVESVQRGIESRGYRPGTLTPREDAVYDFVTRIARGYIEDSFSPRRVTAVLA
jgi:Rieske 2Fe-2S family protein